jgi:hypothetical protein
MTSKVTPNQSEGERTGQPGGEADLGRFLQDWTALWQRELQAQSNDPAAMTGAMEIWRSAMTAWTDALGVPPTRPAASRDRAGTPWAQATVPAFDARDAEIGRLTRRVDELEARLAQLEAPRRPRR